MTAGPRVSGPVARCPGTPPGQLGCSTAGSASDGDGPGSAATGGGAGEDAGTHGGGGTLPPSSSTADGGGSFSDASSADASLPVVPPSPTDGVENGGETDVDCGGASSATSDGAMPCADGLHCLVARDCTSAACNYKLP